VKVTVKGGQLTSEREKVWKEYEETIAPSLGEGKGSTKWGGRATTQPSVKNAVLGENEKNERKRGVGYYLRRKRRSEEKRGAELRRKKREGPVEEKAEKSGGAIPL